MGRFGTWPGGDVGSVGWMQDCRHIVILCYMQYAKHNLKGSVERISPPSSLIDLDLPKFNHLVPCGQRYDWPSLVTIGLELPPWSCSSQIRSSWHQHVCCRGSQARLSALHVCDVVGAYCNDACTKLRRYPNKKWQLLKVHFRLTRDLFMLFVQQ